MKFFISYDFTIFKGSKTGLVPAHFFPLKGPVGH